MDKEAWETLQNTQDRVKQAVNQRFEKDASLYVDRARQDSLKTMLRNGNYQAVAVQQKCGLAPEALARVIVENAWLLPHGPYEPLLAVLYHCRPGYLSASGIMKKVLEDDYDLPKDFRDEVATLCIADADSHTAEAMLESGPEKLPFLNNPRLWTACLHTALKPLPPLEKYRRFSEYAADKKDAYAPTQWKSLNKFFDKESLTDDVLDAAFYDHFIKESSDGYRYWRHVFAKRCAPKALVVRAGSVFTSHTRDFDTCIRVWFSIAPNICTDEAMDVLADAFIRVAPSWHANRLDALGRQIVKKLAEQNRDYAQRAAEIFRSAGMQVDLPQYDEDIPDLDEMAEELDEGDMEAKDFRRMAKEFRSKYWKKRPIERLEELRRKLEDGQESFEGLCLELAEQNPRFPPYLLYAMEHFTGAATVRRMLRIIQKSDMLRSPQMKNHPDELEKVKSFVQEQDFELFKKLMS